MRSVTQKSQHHADAESFWPDIKITAVDSSVCFCCCWSGYFFLKGEFDSIHKFNKTKRSELRTLSMNIYFSSVILPFWCASCGLSWIICMLGNFLRDFRRICWLGGGSGGIIFPSSSSWALTAIVSRVLMLLIPNLSALFAEECLTTPPRWADVLTVCLNKLRDKRNRVRLFRSFRIASMSSAQHVSNVGFKSLRSVQLIVDLLMASQRRDPRPES